MVSFLTLPDPAHSERHGELFRLLEPGSRSAPGLGGDPFVSQLEDQSGWWALGREVGSTWMQVDFVADVPVTRATTDEHGTMSDYKTSWRIAHPKRLFARQWLLWSQLSNPRWDRSVAGASGQVDLQGSTVRFDLGGRVHDVVPGLTAQLSMPAWQSESEVHGERFVTGLRYDLLDFLRVQARWQRGQQPGVLDLDLEGEPWAVSMNLASDERIFEGRLRLPLHFGIEGSFARSDYDAIETVQPISAYHLEPGGRSEWGEAALIWGDSKRRRRALYRWTQGSLDAYGRFSWGGQRFGTVNYARGRIESQLLAAECSWSSGHRILLDYEHVHLRGEARGVIETWPFTSTVIDLLGPRRLGKGWTHARWSRLHTGVELPRNGVPFGRVGLAWLRIRPEAELLTWQPAFLVFGRTDERLSKLELEQLQLLALSTGWRFRLGDVHMDCSLTQFVPIASVHHKTNDDPPVDPEPPTSATGSDSRSWSWPSGTQLALAWILEF